MNNQHSTPRRKLVDILAGQTDAICKQWDNTKAAGEFAPLPGGTYAAHLDAADLHQSKGGTPGVKLVFKVCEGEHTGRLLFADLWLTPAALPQTKRDCIKLGITSPDQLDGLEIEPGRIRCKLRVTLRTDDDGTERNRVKSFDVLGIDNPPDADPFAPGEAVELPMPTEPDGTKGGQS